MLHYGNAAALDLWEMDWDAFTAMPSRYSAEPMLREQRDAFLRSVAERDYADDCAGIRVSSSGKRYGSDRRRRGVFRPSRGFPPL